MIHSRRLIVAAAVLVLAACTLAWVWTRAHQPWRAKQVVLITIDTLRFDRLGLYGYRRRPTSPNLDAWARGTVVFDRATAAAPWTVPSLAALLTGRYPAEVGSYTNGDGIHPDFTTLAELFHARGYATASFNTHALLIGVRGGFRQGFDTVYPKEMKPILEDEHKMPYALTEPHLMEWLDAHAHVRDTVHGHEAVRAVPGAAQEPARPVVLEGAREDPLAGGEERRPDRVAGVAAGRLPVEREEHARRAVDELAWLRPQSHELAPVGPSCGSETACTSFVRVSRSARNHSPQPVRCCHHSRCTPATLSRKYT